MSLSNYLFVCPSFHPFSHSANPPLHPSISSSNHTKPPTHPSTDTPTHPFLPPSIHPSDPINHRPTNSSICPSVQLYKSTWQWAEGQQSYYSTTVHYTWTLYSFSTTTDCLKTRQTVFGPNVSWIRILRWQIGVKCCLSSCHCLCVFVVPSLQYNQFASKMKNKNIIKYIL